MNDVSRLCRNAQLAAVTSHPSLFDQAVGVSHVRVLVVQLCRAEGGLAEGALSRNVLPGNVVRVSTLQVISKAVATIELCVAKVAAAFVKLARLRRLHGGLDLLVILGMQVEDVACKGHGSRQEVSADFAVYPAFAGAILKQKKIITILVKII